MKKFFVLLFVVTVVIGLTGITNVSAISLDLDGAKNITIWDEQGLSTESEDNETEPGTAEGQVWDMEAFFIQDSVLTMVAGFDFKDGVDSYDYTIGDLFIDIDGDAEYGNDEHSDEDWGYEYAVKFDSFQNNDDDDYWEVAYSVYDLFSSEDTTAYSLTDGIDDSNPWKVGNDQEGLKGATFVGSGTGGFWQNLDDSAVQDLTRWDAQGTHYALQIDLNSYIPLYSETYFHLTMECGNDDLIGYAIIPEPSTVFLIGLGLIGLVGLGCKRMKK